MIEPKVQFEAIEVPAEHIGFEVRKVALAVLPGCLERAGYAYDEHGKLLFRKLWDRGLAIDDAFEIAHAFVRASGYVVEEESAESKLHGWPCHRPSCDGSLENVPSKDVHRCSKCGGEVSDALIMAARYCGKES